MNWETFEQIKKSTHGKGRIMVVKGQCLIHRHPRLRIRGYYRILTTGLSAFPYNHSSGLPMELF